MILRRITKHVTDQNWIAVFIDFLIVVVGVYMGLQVQQWALEKDRQVDELAYLNRLHGEVVELGELRKHYDVSRPNVLFEAKKSYQKLKSNVPTDPLTNLECQSTLWISPTYRTVPPSEVPTITELLSAGRLETISSEALRIEILSYTQVINKARDFIGSIQESKSNIAFEYPDLYTLSIGASPDFLKTQDNVIDAICNEKVMKLNHAFMNTLTYYLLSYEYYFNLGITPVSQKLTELHLALDKELGVKHEVAK